MLKSVFGVGANIYKEKHNDKNIVMSNMIMGIVVGFLVFGFIALKIPNT